MAVTKKPVGSIAHVLRVPKNSDHPFAVDRLLTAMINERAKGNVVERLVDASNGQGIEACRLLARPWDVRKPALIQQVRGRFYRPMSESDEGEASMKRLQL